MSVSIDLSRHSGGWRLTPEPQIDLTHWDLDYQIDRIVCTPEPSDLVLTALGTVVLYGLALVFLLAAVKPSWLGFRGPQRPGASSRATEGQMPTVPREPPWSPEEARRIKEDMLQQATKNMSPEKREKFLREIEEKIQQSRERAASAARQGKPLFEWLVFAARLFALLPAALFALPGTLCLRRAIMFFRDRVELSIREESLVVERPQLFGGTSTRILPLCELAAVSISRRKLRRYRRYHWSVKVHGARGPQPSLAFHLANDPSGDHPPQKAQDFAEALARLTGASLVQSTA
jgi:hypothetical protein